MSVFRRLLMLSGVGTSVPYDYPDKFAFFANSAVVEPSILQVLRPSDRLGDFTVVRASDASYTDSSGVIQTAPDNVARIDYTNGVAELLTEPQSTNFITYSEDLTQWGTYISGTGLEPVLTVNSAISPDGTMNAYTVLLDLNGGVTSSDRSMLKSNNIPYTNGASYSGTIYIKASKPSEIGKTVRVRYEAFGFSDTIYTLTDEWVRVENIGPVTADDSASFFVENRGVYTNSASVELDMWGAQLEELPYATSYIPTNGSTVTRLQDTITDGANVNVINSEEGTLFFEGSGLFDDTGENRYLSLSDGTENNVINISYNTNGALIQFLINAGGALILSHAQPAVDITTNAKIAVKWKVNDFAIWINGAEVDTVLSGIVPTGLNSVNLSNAVVANYFNARTRELRIADRALTDEELENLTTL